MAHRSWGTVTVRGKRWALIFLFTICLKIPFYVALSCEPIIVSINNFRIFLSQLKWKFVNVCSVISNHFCTRKVSKCNVLTKSGLNCAGIVQFTKSVRKKSRTLFSCLKWLCRNDLLRHDYLKRVNSPLNFKALSVNCSGPAHLALRLNLTVSANGIQNLKFPSSLSFLFTTLGLQSIFKIFLVTTEYDGNGQRTQNLIVS